MGFTDLVHGSSVPPGGESSRNGLMDGYRHVIDGERCDPPERGAGVCVFLFVGRIRRSELW